MKLFKIFLIGLFFSSNFVFSLSEENFECPDFLNHDIRKLDSKEKENLCKYKKDDFVVLGVPSRDFMFQEYNDEGDVKEFCTTNYGVTFPLFATSKVKGSNANSFYKDLSSKSGSEPSWNFTKYLISKDGQVTDVFSSKIEPTSLEITKKLEALL